jgi:polyribonucleotide nucleotidyltransferase
VNVSSSNQEQAAKALKIIGDLCATAEVGKTYLGTVSRLADFGAFVEILPGLDGLLHISEVAEHRIRDVRDELNEGDQVLVKVLAVDGNRIKLSRKAILLEQRAKMGGDAPPAEGGEGHDGGDHDDRPREDHSHDDRPARPQRSAPVSGSTVIEGGADFEESDEPNFNRVEGAPVGESRPPRSDRPPGGGDRGGRPPRRGGRGGPGGRRGPGGGGRGPSGGGGGRGRF